jgi:hypothetical protein
VGETYRWRLVWSCRFPILGYGWWISVVGMTKLTSSIPFLLSFGCRYGLPGAIEKRLASIPFISTARYL